LKRLVAALIETFGRPYLPILNRLQSEFNPKILASFQGAVSLATIAIQSDGWDLGRLDSSSRWANTCSTIGCAPIFRVRFKPLKLAIFGKELLSQGNFDIATWENPKSR